MNSSYIILAIAVFICLALGIIFFVILYQRRVINHQLQMRSFNHQKELELMQTSIRSEEEERSRIAAELHDDVGASLSAIRLFLHQALQAPGNAALIRQTKDLLDDSIQKVRDLSHQLQPGILQYLGLSKALESFAGMISRSNTLTIEFSSEEGSWPDQDPDKALCIYRIIQELVQNIIKHAAATRIRLSLYRQDGLNCIALAHNGSGLTESGYREQLFKEGATGLKNIEMRLKSASLLLRFPETREGIYTIVICEPAATAIA